MYSYSYDNMTYDMTIVMTVLNDLRVDNKDLMIMITEWFIYNPVYRLKWLKDMKF